MKLAVVALVAFGFSTAEAGRIRRAAPMCTNGGSNVGHPFGNVCPVGLQIIKDKYNDAYCCGGPCTNGGNLKGTPTNGMCGVGTVLVGAVCCENKVGICTNGGDSQAPFNGLCNAGYSLLNTVCCKDATQKCLKSNAFGCTKDACTAGYKCIPGGALSGIPLCCPV